MGGDEERRSIEERKKNALKYFKERLLKSEAGDLIAKIVLFGSVARGEAGEESDIDVLVFALGDLRKVREACADASLWTSIETGESVQPLVYSIDELRFPSFFIYKSVREGEVVFEMEGEEMLRREAEGYLDLAETYFESFKMLKRANMYRVAVDVGYNAVELCIKALILLRAGEIPRTHGGMVKKFVDIMKTGEIPSEIGRKLHLSCNPPLQRSAFQGGGGVHAPACAGCLLGGSERSSSHCTEGTPWDAPPVSGAVEGCPARSDVRVMAIPRGLIRAPPSRPSIGVKRRW